MTSIGIERPRPGIGGRVLTPSVALWGAQAVLALLFVFAGSGKLLASSQTLTSEFSLPADFMRFIGVCELLGGLGLILPGALKIARSLTPLAAAGLVVIMIGATVVTVAQGDALLAAGPALVGVVAAAVARARRAWL